MDFALRKLLIQLPLIPMPAKFNLGSWEVAAEYRWLDR